MKQFNLQEYLTNPSRKVVTRDGRSVRILCTDVKGYCPVLALATYNGIEFPLICSEIGEGDFEKDDLFFSTETKVGWINIYKGNCSKCLYTGEMIYDSKEMAIKNKTDNNVSAIYMATIKIEWEG